jgi:excisionase family DNA binding protein
MAGRRISVPEAAEYLGIPVRTLRKMYLRGDIPYIKLGELDSKRARVLFDTDDLDAYLELMKVEAG